MPKESAFSTKVIKALREEFGGHWRKSPMSPFSRAGVGDIIGCVDGKYVEVELKQPGKYAHPMHGCTSIQLRHATEIEANNGIWIVQDDLECLKAYLRARLPL